MEIFYRELMEVYCASIENEVGWPAHFVA